MPYPTATEADVAFFEQHGWIAIDDAIAVDDLAPLEQAGDVILEKKDVMAFDWAWDADTPKEQRAFKIVQSSPTLFFPALNENPFRMWATEYASALLRQPVEFWYDQFLAKPPHASAPTRWHQDEGYWGRNLEERGITCWMPLHDVDTANGCMQFIDGGHRLGVLEHELVPGVQSDLLQCRPDERRAIACPLRVGGVTFHHSKTPHMTTANESDAWRRILTQHFRVVGSEGEGDHYPWKIYVNQFTGERITPPTR